MTVALGEQMATPNGVGNHTWAAAAVAVGTAGAHNRFLIADGPILLLALWGIIKATLMDGTASTLRIEHSLGNTNICGDLAAIADDAVGTAYYIAGVQASLMVKAEAAVAGVPAMVVANLTPVVCIPGNIDITNGGDQTGTVEWHCVWAPLDPLSSLVVAAYT